MIDQSTIGVLFMLIGICAVYFSVAILFFDLYTSRLKPKASKLFRVASAFFVLCVGVGMWIVGRLLV